MDFTEKTIKSEPIFEGKIIKVKVDTVELPDGNLATREIVEHPGGVAVIAVDNNNEVFMVRQYRKPFDKVCFEVPAGKLDAGEEPLSCGIRELEEETGMKARNFEYLGAFMLSPGFCREYIYIYLATDLYEGTVHLDEGEFLDVEKHKLSDLVDMVMANEIEDAKTVMAILKANELLRRKN